MVLLFQEHTEQPYKSCTWIQEFLLMEPKPCNGATWGQHSNCLFNVYEPEKLTSLTKSQLKETDLYITQLFNFMISSEAN